MSWTCGRLRERANHPGGSLSPHAGLAWLPALLFLSSRGLDSAPPRDELFPCGVGEPQQKIAVTRARCAEAHEVAPAQSVERAQQVVLVRQPPLVFRDDGRAIAIGTNPERISPPAAATDVDGPSRDTRVMLVENPAHRLPPDPSRCVGLAAGRGRASAVTRGASPKRERLAR